MPVSACRTTTGWPCQEVPLVLPGTLKRSIRGRVIEQLRFLLTVHRVQRVVLIAHEECASIPSSCASRPRTRNTTA